MTRADWNAGLATLKSDGRERYCRALIAQFRAATNDEQRAAALDGLIYFVGPEALDLLSQLLTAGAPSAQWLAAFELAGRVKTQNAARVVLDALESARGQELDGRTAARALRAAAESGGASVAGRIAPYLRSPQTAGCRLDVAEALASCGGLDAARALTEAYASGRAAHGAPARAFGAPAEVARPHVADGDLLSALGTMGDAAAAREALRSLLTLYGAEEAKLAIANVAGRNDQRTRAILEPLLNDAALASAVRVQLVATLAGLGSPAAVSEVAQAALQVRGGASGMPGGLAMAVLAGCPPVDPAAREMVEHALALEKDPDRRLLMASHLARSAEPLSEVAAARIVTAVRDSISDSADARRQAGLEVVARSLPTRAAHAELQAIFSRVWSLAPDLRSVALAEVFRSAIHARVLAPYRPAVLRALLGEAGPRGCDAATLVAGALLPDAEIRDALLGSLERLAERTARRVVRDLATLAPSPETAEAIEAFGDRTSSRLLALECQRRVAEMRTRRRFVDPVR